MKDWNKPSSQHALVLLNRDLMVGISISNTAKALGISTVRCSTTREWIARLREDQSSVALAIIDMNLDVDWDEIGAMLSSGVDLPPILGFGPHVDVDGRRAAKQASLTRIVSNGEFHRDMAALIQRYARTTTEEGTPSLP